MRSVKLPPVSADSQLPAHQGVYRLALGRAGGHDAVELRECPLGERPVLERRSVDIDVERRAAGRRVGGRHGDARVADHAEITDLAGTTRQVYDLRAIPG